MTGLSRGGVGVLGGTFNPPHAGHVALARAAAEELRLERVLLTPARVAPHKPLAADPGAEQRLSMCRLAVAADPRLGVCAFELDRPGPSYTIDTLNHIHINQPEVELTLILGADTARTLPSWREPREIVRLAWLAVAERERIGRQAVCDALRDLNGTRRIVFLDMAPIEVSSSMVRARAAAGEAIDELVGHELAGYIAAHGLYREDLGARAGTRAARRTGRARGGRA